MNLVVCGSREWHEDNLVLASLPMLTTPKTRVRILAATLHPLPAKLRCSQFPIARHEPRHSLKTEVKR
jgi:hypothetical protein